MLAIAKLFILRLFMSQKVHEVFGGAIEQSTQPRHRPPSVSLEEEQTNVRLQK